MERKALKASVREKIRIIKKTIPQSGYFQHVVKYNFIHIY